MPDISAHDAKLKELEDLAGECLRLLVQLHEVRQDTMAKITKDTDKKSAAGQKASHSVVDLEMTRTRLQVVRHRAQHLIELLKQNTIKPEDLNTSIEEIKATIDDVEKNKVL